LAAFGEVSYRMTVPEGPITFRRLTAADLPLLHEWLGRPHVAEWWQPTPTLAELTEDYDDPTASTRAFIASAAGEPVGFIQAYVALGSGNGWWEEESDPGVRGIDQFLARPEHLGHGLGTSMVRTFVAQLFLDAAVTRVQTDPCPENARAIRCYEKAGFRASREVDTPDGRALLMYCDRVPATART